MSDQQRRGPGRPQAFDRDEVLDRLVILFWTKGYDDTTHADIRETSGLSGSSLDRAFGPKPALFATALDRYFDMSAALVAPLEGSDGGLAALSEWTAFLGTAITSGQAPPGCLVVSSHSQPVGQQAEIRERVDRYFDRLRDALRQTLSRAGDLGEINPATIDQKVAVIEAIFIGTLTAAKAHATPDNALAMLAGLDDLIDAWSA